MSAPRLDRAPLQLPPLAGYSEAIWGTLLELADAKLHDWTLIGGQMVLLHALEHGAEPNRLSTDLDVLVNARVVASAVRDFVRTLESLGFSLAGSSPDGVAHRYERDRASIDVLAPEGLGPRADLTTTPPGRTIQVPAGTQALARTELLPVEFAGTDGLVPRPSLLGAIICKAAAVLVDDAPNAQRRDLALLLSLVPNPAAMAQQLTRKDRSRLRDVADIADPHHEVWSHMDPAAADRGRLAMVSLVRETSLDKGPAPEGSLTREFGGPCTPPGT